MSSNKNELNGAPVKFSPVFSVPHFLLTYLQNHNGEIMTPIWEGETFKVESQEYSCCVCQHEIFPFPLIKDTPQSMIVVMGSPIIGDKIDPEAVASELFPEGLVNESFLNQINGEFLVCHFEKKSRKLTVINDRYTSIPFYYYFNSGEKQFCGSPFFSDVWSWVRNHGNFKVDEIGLLEFIYFQRLLGGRTYLEDGVFLADASILEYDGDKLSTRRYWQRNYQKNQRSLGENAGVMAELVRQSIKRKTSRGERFGHFLSGGMDSRSVLAGFSDNFPICFTATVSENREFNTARKIAHTKGADHVGLELDQEHYGRILEPMVQVIGGMYNFDHGLFLGYNDTIKKYADICFHGHGFDYMYQGMYIPAKRVKLFGRNLYLRHIIELPEDIAAYYVSNVSYRIKEANIPNFLVPQRIPELQQKLWEAVNEIADCGRELSDHPNDVWEYLTFHHVSRHYSFPNHASIATFAEQRTISFDNELFDFYLSLPVEHRFDGRIEKACLKILDPKLARIWSANTNLPVTASCWTQTIYQLAGFIKHRFIPPKEENEWSERTWPSRDDSLRGQESLKKAYIHMLESNSLEMAEFLNNNKLKSEIPRWLEGESIDGMSGDLGLTLLTLGTFLNQN